MNKTPTFIEVAAMPSSASELDIEFRSQEIFLRFNDRHFQLIIQPQHGCRREIVTKIMVAFTEELDRIIRKERGKE